MDVVQTVIFFASWIFFAGWGAVLTALSVVTFGRDLLPFAEPSTLGKNPHLAPDAGS